MKKPRKALLLLSGGLDSRLAARLLQEQGFQVKAINFSNIFSTSTPQAVKAAAEYNIPLKISDITKDLMALVEKPKYGHGSGINPCIDCRILALKKAKEYMPRIGAEFVVTGEVLGERPMSQRKDAIEIIEKQSGLKQRILRPLSAKLFEPTLAEEKGLVDRNMLLDISGRSRKRQMELAKELGVNDYPTPAGGCLLTDKRFAEKARDLIRHKEWNEENAVFIKYGRYFRINKHCRLIIGRDKRENSNIEKLKKENDLLLRVTSHPGPVSLVRGRPSGGDIDLAAALTAYFVTKRKDRDKVTIEINRTSSVERKEVLPAHANEISKYRIGI